MMKKKLICTLLLIQASYLAATCSSLKYPEGDEESNCCFPYAITCSQDAPLEQNENKWAIYLSDKVTSYDLLQYNPIVLSPDFHPPLAPLIVKNKQILARISLADISKKDPYYSELKLANLLLGNNPSAPDRQLIDLRSAIWNDIIINKIMPHNLAEGFTGFCLCNLDVCINLELQDPEKYTGMLDASLQLLAKIRTNYPDAQIMLDLTGLLHKAAAFSPYYDLAYFENLFTESNTKNRKITSSERYSLIVERLLKVKELHPVYTLDFWSFKDLSVVKYMYQMLRKEGFCPYVAERLDVLNNAI